MIADKHSLAKWFERTVITLFIGALAVPMLWGFAGRAAASPNEKRKLEQVPPPPRSMQELWAWPDKFVAFYADHFGFRPALIRGHARLKYSLLGMSPSDRVLVGRDGWLYYADDYSIEDYRSENPFTGAQLRRWRDALVERRDWLARRGCHFLVVLACDKHAIYPENMPEGLARRHETYRFQELAAYLKANSDLDVVAPYDELMRAKEGLRVYQRTDSHWNDRGAWIATARVLADASNHVRGLPAVDEALWEPSTAVTPGGDLAVMMGLEDLVQEENLAWTPKRGFAARTVYPEHPSGEWNDGRLILEHPDKSLPKLVMFRDSFGSAMLPQLAEYFSRSVFLWQYTFDPAVIEREKPDLVILEIVGRRLQWYEP